MTRFLVARVAPVAFVVGLGVTAACGGAANTVSGPTTPTPSTAPSPSPFPSPSPSPAPPPSAPSCTTTTVTGVPSTVPDVSGRYTFSIATPSNCAWTARSDSTWADVAPGSGQGDGAVIMTVTQNFVRDARTATLIVNGQSWRVVQDAARCTYSLNPTSMDLNFDTATATVAITTSVAGCPWTATASESWIRPRTTNGSGTGAITFDIDQNAGDARHAFLTIAGQRVDVTQQRR